LAQSNKVALYLGVSSHAYFETAGELVPIRAFVWGFTMSIGFLILGVSTLGEEGFDIGWSPWVAVGENTDAVYGLNFLKVGLELSGTDSGMSGQNSRSSSASNDLDK